MTKYADIKARKVSTRRSVTVVLDGEIMAQIDSLKDRIKVEARADARENRDPVAPRLRRELDALYDEARKSEVKFTFKSAGRAEFDKLVAEHPATPEQRKQLKDLTAERGIPFDPPKWDPDTFPPAIIAASSYDPELSVAEALDLWEDKNWSPAELLKIFECALSCYWEVDEIPFAAGGIDTMLSSEPSWTTAPSEESLDPSS
jgi:hypothetical protein